MSNLLPPQPTPEQQEYRKHLVRRLKKRGMFIMDANHKGAGTYGLLSPHGKMYIGKSVEYYNRMGKHRRDASYKKKSGKWKENKLLYRAIRKWGWHRFELFLFEKHDQTRADIDDVLNKQEIALIAEFETFTDRSKGYNLTAGGEGSSGRKMTPEQLAAHTARKSTPEAKAAKSAAAKKMWEDPELREKMTAALKEAHNLPEVKAAASARSKKLWEDPEYRKKTSAAIKEVANRPEMKAAQSARSKKLWEDPEYRKKTIAASKKRWADPKYREKTTVTMTEAQNRPEVKAATSAASKERWADPVYKRKMIAALIKPVVSKLLISGKNPIKEYQLIYHTGQTAAAVDLSLLFGIKIDNSTIGKIIKAKKRTRSGFEFERFTNAPGQPTPEQPIKRMRVTNI